MNLQIVEAQPQLLPPSTLQRIADEVLHWYRSDCILVSQFSYENGGILRAHVIPRELDYGIIDMSYLTATQLSLVISQMAYVLTGCICHDSSMCQLNLQAYKILLHNIPSGKCFIVRQNWNFRNMISKECRAVCTLKTERISVLHNRLILKCKLNIEDFSASGESTFLMPLE